MATNVMFKWNTIINLLENKTNFSPKSDNRVNKIKKAYPKAIKFDSNQI